MTTSPENANPEGSNASNHQAELRRGIPGWAVCAGTTAIAALVSFAAGVHYGGAHADNQSCLGGLKVGNTLSAFKLGLADLNQVASLGAHELEQDQKAFVSALQTKGAKLVTITSRLGDASNLGLNQQILTQANTLKDEMGVYSNPDYNPVYYNLDQTPAANGPRGATVTVAPFVC